MKYGYRILQVPHSCGYGFMPFEYAMKQGFKGSDYVSVWYGEVEAETINQALEMVYHIHNMDDRPNGRGMHSLSMSDVVEIDKPYYCDRFGWSEVPSERWFK